MLKALAVALDLPVRDLTLLRGQKSRRKHIGISGDPEVLERALERLGASETDV